MSHHFRYEGDQDLSIGLVQTALISKVMRDIKANYRQRPVSFTEKVSARSYIETLGSPTPIFPLNCPASASASSFEGKCPMRTLHTRLPPAIAGWISAAYPFERTSS